MAAYKHHTGLPTVILEQLDIPSKLAKSKNSSPYSSNEALFNSTPIRDVCLTPPVLRSRRGLHTTPDSSVSSAASSLGSDCCAVDQDDRLNESSRPVCYASTHVYYRNSDDEDVHERQDGRIPRARDGDTKRQAYSQLVHRLEVLGWIALVLVGCLAFIWFCWTTTPSPYATLSLRSLTDQLSSEFPLQNRRFWAQLRAALEPFVHRPTQDTAVPALTAVILLVNLANRTAMGHGPRTDCDPDLFACFQARFRTKLESVARPDPSNPTQCHVIRIPELDATVPSHSKILFELDEALRRNYDSGVRCFQFPPLDRFPPPTVTFFHGVTDPYNTVYASTVLVFTLSEPFDVDWVATAVGTTSADLQVERLIQRHLRNLWISALGLEETDALLSRLARTIAIFRT